MVCVSTFLAEVMQDEEGEGDWEERKGGRKADMQEGTKREVSLCFLLCFSHMHETCVFMVRQERRRDLNDMGCTKDGGAGGHVTRWATSGWSCLVCFVRGAITVSVRTFPAWRESTVCDTEPCFPGGDLIRCFSGRRRCRCRSSLGSNMTRTTKG